MANSPQPDVHPSAELLQAFACGRLSSAQMSVLEPHLSTCSICAERLATVGPDSFLRLAQAASQPTEAPDLGVTTLGEVSTPDVPRVRVVTVDGVEIPEALQDHPRYRILKMLGVGGMGMVYLAEHRLMERQVALKVIAPHLVVRSDAVDRFRQEVRAAARLTHPNIVTAHDAEQAGDLHFLVMEYVEGIDLARFVQRRGPLTAPQALNLIRQAAMGLQHAHERGMVHRDIKPQNLMVTRKGVLKILDFGLARFASEQLAPQGMPNVPEAMRGSITAASMVLGTPDYLAPEQARSSKVDIRADLYSLGCTLYFLLTGRVPFSGDTAIAKMFKHMEEDAPLVSSIRRDCPADVTQLVRRMMAKKPEQRFNTPAELVQTITQLQRNRLRAAGSPTNEEDVPEVLVLEADDAATATPTPTPAARPSGANRTTPVAEATEVLSPSKSQRSKEMRRRKQVEAKRRQQKWVIGIASFLVATVAGVFLSMMLLGPQGDPNSGGGPMNPQMMAQGGPGGPGDRGPGGPKIGPMGGPIGPPNGPNGQPMNGANGPGGPNDPSDGGFQGPLGGLVFNKLKNAYNDKMGRPRGPLGKFGPGRNPNRVLFVLPPTGVWYPDYEPVRRELEAAEYEVVVASTDVREAKPVPMGGGSPIPVDRSLVSAIDSRDFAAVFFCGYDVDLLLKQPEVRKNIDSLIDDMLRQGKPVTALCYGVRVLVELDKLDGMRVATTEEIAKKYPNRDIRWVYQSVALDGAFLTGDHQRSAEAFAQAFVRRLTKPK
ncbi:protein kinase domain-containing protein [Tuwongella immobilis]|uniref:non-specific serine/threonine protein kinase n=1 Tax=Tuwongella immobilis TaxID=692036 RepID=A0A6C2YLQ8_9BACT|nr:protein kinase [Tuwongella immobilis]VIP02251.1 serine threonine protein kinase : Protein containing Serine/threonine protein kinase OS=Rhodopirellula europaea 6C GN=RE6C_01459 PE=4 SV=1: Pkinase: DJ-1_PfpI [Tuwongella immobilis]VTS00840.1 serine threonine protein kinase : Protein containing Serine/threonine protein kinase OS=Rhodopirellula europaea 6C GN=RE6C_01459 PE=4 SV=1: Pkinase: DJ-1_PfpI [Tuwongella immobilis]